MPTLIKAKHELVAQALAAGKSQREAYANGGYSYKPANAHRLCTSRAITTRVDEIVAQRIDSESRAREIAVSKAGLDESWVLQRLKYLTDVSLQGRPIKVNGMATGEYTKADGPTAIKCLALAAKICGLLVNKVDSASQAYSTMSDSELEAFILGEARALGLLEKR